MGSILPYAKFMLLVNAEPSQVDPAAPNAVSWTVTVWILGQLTGLLGLAAPPPPPISHSKKPCARLPKQTLEPNAPLVNSAAAAEAAAAVEESPAAKVTGNY